MTNLELIRRAAKIAGNTKCWIGIGCVIAKGGKIISEAWNETLKGEEYCQEFRNRENQANNTGCIRHELKLSGGKEPQLVCSIHAEILAIIRSVQKGKQLTGSTMFVTSFPCLICIRSIIASGIKKIIYMNDFYKPHHLEMLEKNGVKVEQMNEKAV